MICLTDVAQGLSHCCRFAGQVYDFYSVAQHAILVSELVDPPFEKEALHHDDTEAYMSDLSRHLKHHALLTGYRVLERNLNDAVYQHFGIERSVESTWHVKRADDLAAIFEHWVLREMKPWNAFAAISWAITHQFVKGDMTPLLDIAPRLPRHFLPWPPRQARAAFIAAAETLGA